MFTPAECGLLQVSEHWCRTKDGDMEAYAIFRRHYSCTNLRPKLRQFVGPGQKMILLSAGGDAVFVWRRERYRMDKQTGTNCAVFRNEGATLSSTLIREAMCLAWERWPDDRLFTFINAALVRSSNPGYCFKMAGWRPCGTSAKGLIIMEALP